MSEKKTLHRHGRAVYAALRRMTEDHHLLERCFRFWLQRFGREAALPVNPFVAALHDYVGLDNDQQRVLSVALYAALSRDVQTLPAIPKALLPQIVPSTATAEDNIAAPEGGVETESKQAPHQVVLNAYLSELVANLKRQKGELVNELRDEIGDGLSGASLAKDLQRALQQWANGGFQEFNWSRVPEQAELPQIAHQMYILICEVFGPMLADQAVGRAIREVAELPEAQQYNPSQLL